MPTLASFARSKVASSRSANVLSSATRKHAASCPAPGDRRGTAGRPAASSAAARTSRPQGAGAGRSRGPWRPSEGLPGVGRLLGLLGVVGRLRLRLIGETLLRLVEHGGLQGLVEHDAEAARTEIEDQGSVLVEAEVGGSSGGGGSSDSYRGRPTAALRSRVTATVGGSLAAANSGAESGDSALAACSARYGAHHGHVA